MNSRNGYREPAFDSRAGTISLAIPKLRPGSYFPHWLLEPRRGAEQALTQVVCQVLRRVRTILEQPDAEQVRAQQARAVEQLESRFPEAAAISSTPGSVQEWPIPVLPDTPPTHRHCPLTTIRASQ